MKTESVRMRNAKYELLRHFNEPVGTMAIIARLQRLTVEGLQDLRKRNIREDIQEIDPSDLDAIAWLAGLGEVVHELNLIETFGESFSPGERIKDAESRKPIES